MAEEAEDLPKIHAPVYPGGNNAPRSRNMQLVLGHYNHVAASAVGVLITGDYNVVGEMAQNISLLNSSGCIVAGGLRNVTIINSSGVIVMEENTVVQNNIFTLSPSSGVTTYTPYKKYVAVWEQTGTSIPTAVVMENTFPGALVYSRLSAGVYRATLASAFPTENKILFFQGNDLGGDYRMIPSWIDANTLGIETLDQSDVHVDGALYKTSIEIRIYP